MANQIDVEIDAIMVTESEVVAAQVRVCAAAVDADEAKMFLDMLGIGADRAWNMGAA